VPAGAGRPRTGLGAARVVEHGETLTDALVREVREETGLEVKRIGPLLYAAQLVNAVSVAVSTGEVPPAGGQSIAFIFGIDHWSGDIACADPDGFVQECRFMPEEQAIEAIADLPWRVMREPLLAYLRREAGHGTVWIYRRGDDGEDRLVGQLD
jgi:8-oxo-dGTP diphosphatase